MFRPLDRARTAALVAAATLLWAVTPAAQPRPVPLGGVDRLKAWFNDNRAQPRAIVLLSPT